ncbi:MAG: NnrS family protein [Hyphomicrobiaceae bacterium]|nr:NnrS family protein [Hyphomicrobiaceae bacterium]
MTSTLDIRHRPPPAVLSLGFRPFFLLGALFAALMIAMWVPWFLGLVAVPSAFPPAAWHAHELLFGFMPAIMAGFLLTAVPSWTGRLPIAGWPLAGLVLVWLAGRIGIACSAHLGAGAAAGLSVAFPLVLAAAVGYEIVAAGNRRNLRIVAVLLGLAAADALFHYEIWQFGRTKLSHTAAVALALMLLMIVAGRIVPAFTANWLKQHRPGALPRSFGAFDVAAMVLSGAALLAWVGLPLIESKPWGRSLAGAAMLAAAAASILRQARWTPHRTFAEPLLAILHIAYVFVGLGFLLAGLGVLWNDYDYATAGLHAWTAGAIAVMMLAVMTRVTRGHTGRKLTAPAGTVVLYAFILVAAVARIGAGLHPE